MNRDFFHQNKGVNRDFFRQNKGVNRDFFRLNTKIPGGRETFGDSYWMERET